METWTLWLSPLHDALDWPALRIDLVSNCCSTRQAAVLRRVLERAARGPGDPVDSIAA